MAKNKNKQLAEEINYTYPKKPNIFKRIFTMLKSAISKIAQAIPFTKEQRDEISQNRNNRTKQRMQAKTKYVVSDVNLGQVPVQVINNESKQKEPLDFYKKKEEKNIPSNEVTSNGIINNKEDIVKHINETMESLSKESKSIEIKTTDGSVIKFNSVVDDQNKHIRATYIKDDIKAVIYDNNDPRYNSLDDIITIASCGIIIESADKIKGDTQETAHNSVNEKSIDNKDKHEDNTLNTDAKTPTIEEKAEEYRKLLEETYEKALHIKDPITLKLNNEYKVTYYPKMFYDKDTKESIFRCNIVLRDNKDGVSKSNLYVTENGKPVPSNKMIHYAGNIIGSKKNAIEKCVNYMMENGRTIDDVIKANEFTPNNHKTVVNQDVIKNNEISK